MDRVKKLEEKLRAKAFVSREEENKADKKLVKDLKKNFDKVLPPSLSTGKVYAKAFPKENGK